MPDVTGQIRVLAAQAATSSSDGKDVTIPIQTDQAGTIEAVFSREVLAEVALQFGQTVRQFGGTSRMTLIPRRIDVIKDHLSPDTFLKMEIDDKTTYVVPIGPQLVSALIEGLDRARRVIPPTSTRQ